MSRTGCATPHYPASPPGVTMVVMNQPDVEEKVVMDAPHLGQPRTLKAFHNMKLFLRGYLGIGVAALVTTYWLRNDAAAVNSAVWTRGIIVVVTALLLLVF